MENPVEVDLDRTSPATSDGLALQEVHGALYHGHLTCLLAAGRGCKFQYPIGQS